MAKIVVTDIKKCLACKSCELACAVAHSQSKGLEDAIGEAPLPQRRITVEAAVEFAVPMQCRHCEDAPCIHICPTGALHRADPNEPVLINVELCVGCKFCMVVCPFGAISLSRDGRTVTKCDLCLERTSEGLEPACLVSCPTKAIRLVELDQHIREKKADADQHTYIIDAELCKACGKCIGVCPTDAIFGERKVAHVIDQSKCVKCGSCKEICPFDAVEAGPAGDVRSGDDGAERGMETRKKEPEQALCEVCEQPFATVKQLEYLRERMPKNMTLEIVCDKCRRSQTAVKSSMEAE